MAPLAILVVLGSLAAGTVAAQTWGTLANPGFEGQPMKSVYFFAGDWRAPAPGAPFYGLLPARNDCIYTIHPLDARHLGWSESQVNREYAVNLMLAAGVNVVTMSYWSPDGDDVWAWFAPMQTAIGAHNELFDTAGGRPLLILPAIEEADANNSGLQQPLCNDLGPIGHSAGYHFKTDFPGTEDDPAPGLVARIKDLIGRYLKNPAHPEWADKWVKMYDKDTKPRYAIAIIHVGSDQLFNAAFPDQIFAQGFKWVADKVFNDTLKLYGAGIDVGFTLDVLPPEFLGPAAPAFKATSAKTAQYLVQVPAVLAIQAFVPEVFNGICARKFNPDSNCDQVTGSAALDQLINWKRQYVQGWVGSEYKVPLILDVAPGYDARIIFSDPDVRYGNNDPWRNAQSGFLSLGVIGLVGNTWNGYTEGYAIPPSCGLPPGLPCSPANPSDVTYRWFRDLIPPGGSPAKLPTAITSIGPASGAYSDAVTLTARLMEALSGSPLAGRTLHFKVGSQSVDGATDANGTARVPITLNQQPATVDRIVSFAGDNNYLTLSVKDRFVITREATVLRYTGPQVIANVGTASLSALLTDDDGQPLSAKTVSFTLGSGATAQSCTDVTGPAGNAGCPLNISQVLGPQTISVKFAGDSYYEPASTTASVVIFAYLPSGSFILADRAAQAGASVIFWSDVWFQINKPSGGPAPSSFKGFANDVGGYPPRCGVNWKTTTGNSPPPPAGPLPSYMAVSVASAVNQLGSIAAGNTQRIVVVHTDPGYAPDPSHPGTGTVVATVCGP